MMMNNGGLGVVAPQDNQQPQSIVSLLLSPCLHPYPFGSSINISKLTFWPQALKLVHNKKTSFWSLGTYKMAFDQKKNNSLVPMTFFFQNNFRTNGGWQFYSSIIIIQNSYETANNYTTSRLTTHLYHILRHQESQFWTITKTD